MSDRKQATVRLTDQQYELLRRRCLSNQVTVQTVLAACVNAYILGDLRVTAAGRYHVVGPAAPLSRDDEVTVRAPSTDEPQRTVTVKQPPAAGSDHLSTEWLAGHVEQQLGRSMSTRLLRRLLAHLEEQRVVEPRQGRYWRFTGPDDPTVAAVRIAVDDGTLDDLVSESLESYRKSPSSS